MSTKTARATRRRRGLPNWRIVRYADDFAVLVHGTEADTMALHEDISQVLATMGLRFSAAKTQVVHLDEGFDFLGFRIQRRRKRGTNRWYVYTFIADRPVRSVKTKIRAITTRASQQNPGAVLIRLRQILGGWANYFRHAVCKHTFGSLAHFTWWRVARWLMTLHRWTWKALRREFTGPTGRWMLLSADGKTLFDIAEVSVTRYRWRGHTIPTPWALPTPA